MRLHVWDDDNPPTVHMEAEDEYIRLVDYPHWVGYEVGDQVQYVSGLGTEVYLVIEVEPEYNYFDSVFGMSPGNLVLLEQVR